MSVKKTFMSLDGNGAAARVSYLYTDIAAIYPITPSSTMAELVDLYSSQGKLNYFGSTVKVTEMQSEAGAAGAVHGSLQGGTLATTYTASQGLLLMLPNIYKWVGELLPAVLHVSARSVAARSLSIFGDHQDIYAVRQTGVTMLVSHSVQEVADLSHVAHLIAIEASAPMLHFFDGFRTSHEIQNVEVVEDAEWQKLLPLDKVAAFRSRALNPHTNPVTRGGAENDDISFQGKEAQNTHYNRVLGVAEKYLAKASALTGRNYAPFVYHGAKDATKVIIAMGSVTEALLEVVNDLNKKGEKVGLVKVHLYRPFANHLLAEAIPASVKHIAILDRTKEVGAVGEPLYVDVVTALEQVGRRFEKIVGGRYGISSRDTQPKHLKAVYDRLDKDLWHSFTIGIHDDVTKLSVPWDESYHIDSGHTECLFYGLGSDGTVSANRSSIQIIGEATGQYAQAYFAYDSRKAGGPTRSYLRFGKTPIHSTYYVENASFISCSQDSYLYKFDMIRYLKTGGTFLLNTSLSGEALINALPNRVKYGLATKQAKFFVIDANKIAQEIGMGRHTNTILQSSFFYLNEQIMPYDEALRLMKDYAEQTYGRKGDEIVNLNHEAIDMGSQGVTEVKIDPEWAKLKPLRAVELLGDRYFDEYVNPIDNLEGYDLPVSRFTEWDLLDGTMTNDITFKQKRKIAAQVPRWIKENCIQCNTCSLVCPHATIRPFLLTPEEIEGLPENVKEEHVQAMGPTVKDYRFRIQVSPMNCVGCALCVVTCPGRGGKKALEMVDAKTQYEFEPAADYLYKQVSYKSGHFPLTTPKGVGFLMPYMEISGACAGCGETPYYRLITQLFGRDMLVANATGCSSIYCGSVPGTPFTTNKDGEGVAWGNSLFEDNAEYGFGMRVAQDYKLALIMKIMNDAKGHVDGRLAELIDDYVANYKNRDHVRGYLKELVALIEKSTYKPLHEVLKYKDDILDKSVWIIGGDGWAYDIGYGGLDHVLATGANVNILVMDTEVYSNTGGQSSKATQAGAIAKFAASGKPTAKKNLAMMAMAYDNVYVAQVALGANPVATIRAIREAEAFDGPSIIIAYSPCIEHGIRGGLSNHISVEKKAVTSGYWPIFRYDPRLEDEGKSPLMWDMKEPNYEEFREFVMGETRFSQLPHVNPDNAEMLLTKSEEDARKRYLRLRKFE